MGVERDTIVLLGLNESGAHEAKALREKGNKVIYIGPGSTAASIKVGKTTYRLKTHKEITAFVESLGLDSAHEKKAITAFNISSVNIRDELAQLAIVWSGVQKTGSGATRFVISGHSTGDGLYWGDKSGMLTLNNISKLAESMQKAAGAIEDLHLSACYSGKEKDLKRWQKVLPNVHTIWAYTDSAPGAHSGATLHMSQWDDATRENRLELNRAIAANTRKGKSVAVWSKRFGYQARPAADINSLKRRIRRAENSYYIEYFNGTRAVINTQSGPLRDYYNDIHELTNHPQAGFGKIADYLDRIKTTIRLLYFTKSIRKKFYQLHAKLIKTGYEKLGLKAPVFSQLSRKECMKSIDDFLLKYEAKKEKSPELIKLKDELTNGLRDLEESHIPANWVD